MTLKPTENFLKGIDYLADMALRHGGLQALGAVNHICTELRAAHAVAEAAKKQITEIPPVAAFDFNDKVREAVKAQTEKQKLAEENEYVPRRYNPPPKMGPLEVDPKAEAAFALAPQVTEASWHEECRKDV